MLQTIYLTLITLPSHHIQCSSDQVPLGTHSYWFTEKSRSMSLALSIKSIGHCTSSQSKHETLWGEILNSSSGGQDL